MTENELVQCVLCGHRFHPGDADGFVYCSACGRRFNPHSALEETVVLPPPETGGTPASGLPGGDGGTSASRRFGDYDIIDEIARGGMGVVYLARQRVLRRVVALKVLRSGDNASDEERERLLREAKAAAGLSHPNIVPIHEFAVNQGQPYFTMDYIEGQPLDRLLENGALNVRTAVAIIEQVARAIGYAHSRGIIHRDLKPANIIIDAQGRPMITDFGLAVELAPEGEAQQRMTLAGSVMGTIPYAPPEQAAGKIDQITERSDVYSMGAVLYEMVTGRPPFTGFTQFELMRRVINQEPTPPRRINPKVHRDVETIIQKCLEKDPRRRYERALAFADDCHSFLKGEVIAARPATVVYRCRKFMARRPGLTFLSLLVVILSLSVWTVANHFRVLAKEKEATEQALESSRAEAERIALEMAEAEREVRRDWRTEYNINFDYYFRWESDLERSRSMQLPWLNPAMMTRTPLEPPRARLLHDPPRWSLADRDGQGAGPETPFEGSVDMGLPFSFPREARAALRLRTPAEEKVGELLLSLDLDRDYRHHLGTTTVRVGSPSHPGVNFYRSETIIGEEPSFAMKPDTTYEMVLERADNKLRVLMNNAVVLEVSDPPPVFNSENGRLAIDVKDGALEFLDLSLELRSMSRNLVTSLIETANSMAAQGRADVALRLYINVLLEPTDPQNRLRALRGYARSLWLGLPRRDRGVDGIEKACLDLSKQLMAAGRVKPGEIDYLIGLSLAFNSAGRQEGLQALQYLDRSAASAHSAASEEDGEYGDLARLETMFVYLRMGSVSEAALRFQQMYENGTIDRLYARYGPELGGGGQAALLLERVDPLINGAEDLELASTLLRAAASLVPSSRETASRFRRLARIFDQKGDAAKAVEMLHWAERLSPDWFRPYLDEAQIHFAQNEPGRAGEALERGKTAGPQSLDLHIGVARLYLEDAPARHQDPVRGEEAARIAATLSQNTNPTALELLAAALNRQGRLDEARAAIDAAIALERTETRVKLRDQIGLLLHGDRANGNAE